MNSILAPIALLLMSSGLLYAEQSAAEHATAGETAWWLVALFTLQGLAIVWLTRRRYFVREGGELKPAFFELQEYSFFLLSGAITAQLWVHGNAATYHATLHHVLLHWSWLELDVTLHFLANDIFMAFFFGIAAKELTEAILMHDGALRGKQAILPLFALLARLSLYILLASPRLHSSFALLSLGTRHYVVNTTNGDTVQRKDGSVSTCTQR